MKRLGLAISKEFIEAQNGSIGLDSALGLGSTFYFKLGLFKSKDGEYSSEIHFNSVILNTLQAFSNYERT